MNPFINPHNRSIDLPEGCTDLMDVLNLKRANNQQLPDMLLVSLADVESYVSRFTISAAKIKALWVLCSDTALSGFGISTGKLGLRVLVYTNVTQGQPVRAIFAGSGLATPLSDQSFIDRRVLYFQLSSLSGLDQLIRKLLTNGFGAEPDATFRLLYHESDKVGLQFP